MKIVINNCYGGFGVSPEAVAELYRRGMQELARDPAIYFKGKFGRTLNTWRKYKANTPVKRKSMQIIHPFSDDEKYVLVFDNHDNKFRTNPIFIALVEEWGSARVSDIHAQLCVINIPDDVNFYTIEDYDGRESVEESHRSWP